MIRPTNGLPAGTDADLSPREQLRQRACELRRHAADLDALADQLEPERPIISSTLIDRALERMILEGYRSLIMHHLTASEVRDLARRVLLGAHSLRQIGDDTNARKGLNIDDNTYQRFAARLRQAIAEIQTPHLLERPQ